MLGVSCPITTMKLERADGSYFEMSVVGYEFPELDHEDYDSNWLMTRIDVKHPLGSWSAIDPSLLTYEMASLADWLEEISSGSRSNPDQGFIEPCLEFHIKSDTCGEEILVVKFSHEYSPPWSRGKLDEDEEHYLEFPLTELRLEEAVESLRGQLKN